MTSPWGDTPQEGASRSAYMARHQGYGRIPSRPLCGRPPVWYSAPIFPTDLPRQAVLDNHPGHLCRPPQDAEGFRGYDLSQLRDPRHIGVDPRTWDWRAASWATASVANTWLDEEALFQDLITIRVPTLILHGLNDKACLFPIGTGPERSHSQRCPDSI